tara:strand:- start:783 stop:1175 length:393 start_codon:yes stop_codon:yes gene_type:complete
MTKSIPLLEQFFTELAAKKHNLVTANILDGVKDRLKKKDSITPKQALWLLEKIKKDQAVTKSMAAELMSVMESGGLDDQKLAERTVRKELVVQPAVDKAAHFNSLFDTETAKLVSELDTITTKLKNKAGL